MENEVPLIDDQVTTCQKTCSTPDFISKDTSPELSVGISISYFQEAIYVLAKKMMIDEHILTTRNICQGKKSYKGSPKCEYTFFDYQSSTLIVSPIATHLQVALKKKAIKKKKFI